MSAASVVVLVPFGLVGAATSHKEIAIATAIKLMLWAFAEEHVKRMPMRMAYVTPMKSWGGGAASLQCGRCNHE